METWYGLLVYIGVFLMGVFGAKWSVSFAKSHHKGDETLPLGMVVLISSFIGMSFFLSDTRGADTFFLYALMAIGLVLMVLFDGKMTAIGYAIGSIVLCFVCTYFLPTMPMIGDGIGGIFWRFALAIGWSFALWVFLKMDRIPFFSMTFSIAFAFFYFLLANVSHRVPDIFSILALLLLSIQVGVNWYLKGVSLPVLGRVAGAFVGFIWGGLTIYVVAKGYVTQALILYAYPMMEVLWALLVCVAVSQRFEPAYPYMIEQALSKNIQPDKVLKNVTKWLVVMACLAYLSVVNVNLSTGVFYVCAGILMINACMRLTSWGQWGAKGPRWRDMFKDLKSGLKQAKEELSKLPLKEVKEQFNVSKRKTQPIQRACEKKTVNMKRDDYALQKGASSNKKTYKNTKKSPENKRGG